MPFTLSQKIEALLFYKTEPMTIKNIAKILEVKENAVEEALLELQKSLENRGVVLIENSETVMLGTHPEASLILEAIRKEELGGSLSKSALETLTIVSYKNGITKSEIDYIRGVNSNFILRNLLMRGLIERKANPEDKRSPLYQPTVDTLTYLGITNVNQLPEYETMSARLEALHTDYVDQTIEG